MENNQVNYTFELSYFAISDKGLHFLRNSFNYKTIKYKDIDSLIITRAKESRVWYRGLVFGCLLLLFVIYDVANIFSIFESDSVGVIYIERLLIPIIPFLLGLYSVIISLRNSLVLKGDSGKDKIHFSLRKIIKRNEFDSFKDYIKLKYPRLKLNF